MMAIMGMKTTKSTRFSNQNENKDRPNFKFKSWNKKIRTRTWHMQNKNSIKKYYNEKKKNKTRLWQENIPKINVEHIEGNQ
jgi:hypothetical protein